MEIRNNCSPAFTGIHIKSSAMNDLQNNMSHKLANMLDYTDEYIKAGNEIDVYILPGQSEKSVTFKFLDTFSDMLFRNGKKQVQVSYQKKTGNTEEFIEKVRGILKDIKTGKIDPPDYDETKMLNGTTDLAKIDSEAYDGLVEDIATYKAYVGQDEAEAIALDAYQKARKNLGDSEF